jgi:hypothetical protein
MAQVPLVGQYVLTVENSRAHSDIPHSVRLLWTSDQSNADLYLTTHDRHPCLRRDSNPQSQQASGRKPTLWTARNWNRLRYKYKMKPYSIITNPKSQLPHSLVYRIIRIDTFVVRGEPLTETIYVCYPINYKYIPAVIRYIYELLNYWFL